MSRADSAEREVVIDNIAWAIAKVLHSEELRSWKDLDDREIARIVAAARAALAAAERSIFAQIIREATANLAARAS